MRHLDRDAVAGRLAGKLLQQRLFGVMHDHRFVVDFAVGSGGGTSGPIIYVSISVNHPCWMVRDRLYMPMDRR